MTSVNPLELQPGKRICELREMLFVAPKGFHQRVVDGLGFDEAKKFCPPDCPVLLGEVVSVVSIPEAPIPMYVCPMPIEII